MGVGGQRQLLPLYPQERSGTHCIGGWVDRRTGLDRCEKSRPPAGIRSLDCPDLSESLYRLWYPDRMKRVGIMYVVYDLQSFYVRWLVIVIMCEW